MRIIRLLRQPRPASSRAAIVGALRATAAAYPVQPDEPKPNRLAQAVAALLQAEACGAEQRNEPRPLSLVTLTDITVDREVAGHRSEVAELVPARGMRSEEAAATALEAPG